MPETVQDLCTCGHILDTHVHFRAGRDCGECGATVCPSFISAASARGSVGSTGAAGPGGLSWLGDRLRSWVRHRGRP